MELDLPVGNGYGSGLVMGKPNGWGARHTVTILGFFGMVVCYCMRFNMSIAIVAMVNKSAIPSSPVVRVPVFQEEQCAHLNSLQGLEPGKVYTTIDRDGNSGVRQVHLKEPAFLASNGSSKDAVANLLRTAGKGEMFAWDEEVQGIILGSFFWGYCIAQIPGGYLSQRYGGKWPFGVGVAISALFTFLTPLAASWGKTYLIAVRVVQGISQGAVIPSMHGLLAQWAPVCERSRLSAIAFAGMTFGTALITFVSGYIIHYFGWPAVFYACGLVSIIWVAFWSFFVSNSPREHPTISDYELKYILRTQSHNTEPGLTNVPWRSVITCVPFWGILVCISLETWGFYTLSHETPTYIQNILHFNIIENSTLSTMPHILSGFVTLAVSYLGDWLINKDFVSVLFVRKSCTTIAFWGGAAAMLGVAYSGCNRTATVALLVIAMGVFGARIGGALINMIDIAPNYASILMGVVTTCGTVSAYVAPWVAGIILKGNATLERWRIVFLLSAGICFLANSIYLLTASDKEQIWNRPDFKRKPMEQGPAALRRSQRSGDLNPGNDYRDAVIIDVAPFPRNAA